MRTIVAICLGLALVGCAGARPYSLIGMLPTSQEARRTLDDAKCREFGFKPETDAYGNCRLQLEQIRATQGAARTPLDTSLPKIPQAGLFPEQPVVGGTPGAGIPAVQVPFRPYKVTPPVI